MITPMITPRYYILYSLISLMIIIACAFVVIKKPFSFNKTVIISIVFMSLFSLGFYQYIGYSQVYRDYLYTAKINQLIIEIQAHLQKDPSSREGWYLLGKLYASQNRVKEANYAYAITLRKDR